MIWKFSFVLVQFKTEIADAKLYVKRAIFPHFSFLSFSHFSLYLVSGPIHLSVQSYLLSCDYLTSMRCHFHKLFSAWLWPIAYHIVLLSFGFLRSYHLSFSSIAFLAPLSKWCPNIFNKSFWFSAKYHIAWNNIQNICIYI